MGTYKERDVCGIMVLAHDLKAAPGDVLAGQNPEVVQREHGAIKNGGSVCMDPCLCLF